jgi:UrcA family protein
MSNTRHFVPGSRIANLVRDAILPLLAFASSAVAWAGDPVMPTRTTALHKLDSTGASEDCPRGDSRDTARASRQPAKADATTTSMKVSLADLDLSSAQGNQAAQKRLRRAAERLCSRLSDELDLGRQQHVAACIERAMADAQRRITAGQLAARSTR